MQRGRAVAGMAADGSEANRGRALGAVIKEKDEELALFLEVRRREKERGAAVADQLLLSGDDAFSTKSHRRRHPARRPFSLHQVCGVERPLGALLVRQIHGRLCEGGQIHGRRTGSAASSRRRRRLL